MAATKCLVMEAKSLQSIIKDLHRKMDPSLILSKVPSWKYPGSLAVDINIDRELKELSDCVSYSEEQRLIVLELLIDRIMLLLQSLLVCSTNSHGDIPLTFSTVFRKLIKILMKKDKPAVNKVLSTTATSSLYCSKCNCLSVDKSCQTIQTSFNVCSNCNLKVDTLLLIVQSFGDMVHSTCGKSKLSKTKWKEMVDSGQIKESQIKDMFLSDQLVLSEYFKRMVYVTETHHDTIDSQSITITSLELKCSDLRNDLITIEEKLERTKCNYQKHLSESQKSFETKLNELRRKLDTEIKKSEILLKESNNLKRTLSELKQDHVTQGILVQQLTVFIEEHKSNELDSKNTNSKLLEYVRNLESQLQNKNSDYEEAIKGIDATTVNMKKTESQAVNLTRKCKSLMSEQTLLVNRIHELDAQSSLLNEQIEELRTDNININSLLVDMTVKVEKCEIDLSLEKENNCKIMKQKNEMEIVIQSLEDQLRDAMDSKQLLMEYPYTCDVNSLQHVQDNLNCINSNNTRILLLEEQNSEIRKRILSLIYQLDNTVEIKQPLQLWQSTRSSSD